MKTIYHSAESRGHANHGWLNTYHTFSFANYYNSDRMNFGTLRVLNDDTVQAGMGFGKHPHKNMEIISIPLEGDLQHGDSMGNEGIIRKGEIQVMSAGSGMVHSEKNANNDKEVKFLQLWILSRERDVEPRYDQKSIIANKKLNDFQQILSPNPSDGGVWIHQDAWMHLANFEKGISKEYKLKKSGNGVYVFVLEGQAKIENQILNRRDGMGIWDTGSFELTATEHSEILLIEVPMELPQYTQS
ncbi:MAG: pirin family protein [Bacteroidia bacterium]|nr:pirin family protein [Bacteroidia bacterium]MCO5254748.1 pirin family protein [Bacteroidota bacterium]